ncbi:MAG: ATP-binding cassette domain-containing protein [Phycisphaerales bacterium]|nr:MAG: ATP-binding cassette domain-containing protein [Phycisphaerales bacterium]
MNAFGRLFKHIWPQWPLLVVIVFSAVLISILFSLSFLTIAPLLKVMMGEEGLHGWADRKVCDDRYGLRFYMPDRVDFVDPNKPDLAYYLDVTRVKAEGRAEAAGLRERDRIVGVGDLLIAEETDQVSSARLLEELALSQNNMPIRIQYRRIGAEGSDVLHEATLESGPKPFYLDSMERLMSFVPRQQSARDKTRVMSFIIIAMAIFTVMRCTARFFQQYFSEKVVQTAVSELRKEVFSHILRMPVSFLEKDSPSDAVSRLVRDTAEVSIGAKTVFGKALREPLKAVALLAGAMLIDLKLTLIFMGSVPFIGYAIAKLGSKIKRATRKSLASWSLMLGKLKETFTGIKVVKVYNQQDRENANFDAINRGLLKQLFRIAKVDAGTEPIMDVLAMFAGGAALLFGAHWVARQEIDPSHFITLVALLGASAESVRKSSDIWNKLQQANAAAERVYAIIDRQPEVESPNAYVLEPLRNKIEFSDVVFTYPGAETAALNHIDLSVEAGHNVALVGPNGSGKTTLANLIPRFHDPDSGQILIDGRDMRDATLESLRGQIGMVTQNVITFHDTIAANIAYGRHDATREEVIAAARRSFAHEFIAPLPAGYDTIIGEEGIGLSGGQLQRIVIARAILKNPAILIFDEATSQVDADSEAKIHNAIEEIMKDRTSFIIAHRFSTVISADVIVVMDRGQIVAQGQHEELMQVCPLYQSLYETQLVRA